MTVALIARVELLADDVGRLRRALGVGDKGSYGELLLERICGHVETLDAMLRPTAADRQHAHLTFGLDEAEAVREALALAEDDARACSRRLGRSQA